MKYDFDTVIPRRNTQCAKWDLSEALFGSREAIPMWVADMDLPVAKPITDAIQKRTDHAIFGYPERAPKSTIDAVINRIKRLYNWTVHPDWIVFTPGVVPALYGLIKALTDPGDSVLCQGPVYYPFWSVINNNGCLAADNQLQLVNNRYEVDFDDLENWFKPKGSLFPEPSRIKSMILSNPHNPVGRVWSESELRQMGEIVLKNNAVMISDEIHCELLFKGFKHVPFATLSEEFEQRSVTCMAASKTFNLAGLGASVIIIPDPEIRAAFARAKNGIMGGVNIFGLTALEAAFNEGDEWLSQLLEYLEGNLQLVKTFLNEKVKKINLIQPEGTYLLWLDCRKLKLSASEMMSFIKNEIVLGMEEGSLFGPNGEGFIRMNIACPRSVLTEALNRIQKAVDRNF